VPVTALKSVPVITGKHLKPLELPLAHQRQKTSLIILIYAGENEMILIMMLLELSPRPTSMNC